MIPARSISLLVLAAGLPVLARAQTELFIGEYQYQAARMAAIRLDGSNPRTLFPLAPAAWLPIGITVNPATNKLIWIDSAGASEVMQADLDGSNTQVLANITGFARGTSIDAAGRIYYATDNRVERVNADGTGRAVLYTSASPDPVLNPRVDGVNGHIYFGIGDLILRSNLDGNHLKIIVRGVLTPRCISVDVADGFIYWIDTNTFTDFVARARLDGTDLRVLYDVTPNNVTSSFLSSLILDPVTDTLYWCDEVAGTVTRAAADGSGSSIIYTAPSGLAPAGLTFSTGEPPQVLQDCNGNGQPPQVLQDCNGNGQPDDADIAAGAPDCDDNGRLDSCQIDPCPDHVFLLDQGSNALSSSGRAVGRPSQWQVFQPFTVPEGGWTLGTIGLDGFTVNYIAEPSGLAVSVFPDNPATSLPNEAAELAATQVDLHFSINSENWVYAPLSVSLQPGVYWIRIQPRDPVNYQGTINFGFSGMQSRSRGVSGNFTALATPIALRLIQAAPPCPADYNQDGGVDGSDVEAFFVDWQAGDSAADTNQDGGVDGGDVEYFFIRWEAGGC